MRGLEKVKEFGEHMHHGLFFLLGFVCHLLSVFSKGLPLKSSVIIQEKSSFCKVLDIQDKHRKKPHL